MSFNQDLRKALSEIRIESREKVIGVTFLLSLALVFQSGRIIVVNTFRDAKVILKK